MVVSRGRDFCQIPTAWQYRLACVWFDLAGIVLVLVGESTGDRRVYAGRRMVPTHDRRIAGADLPGNDVSAGSLDGVIPARVVVGSAPADAGSRREIMERRRLGSDRH